MSFSKLRKKTFACTTAALGRYLNFFGRLLLPSSQLLLAYIEKKIENFEYTNQSILKLEKK